VPDLPQEGAQAYTLHKMVSDPGGYEIKGFVGIPDKEHGGRVDYVE
jgi:hypothetical protein